NIGAGFDCIGASVDRWLTLTAALDAGRPGFAIGREGTLASLQLAADDDRIVAGFRAACRRARAEVPEGVRLDATSRIPVGRGLGSSAAATVAGALAANELLELGLSERSIAVACTEVEGHPDNVVPALYGGARLAVKGTDGALLVTGLDVHPSLAFVFAIPSFAVETTHARSVLPATIPHATASRAAALGAALVEGLSSSNEGLLAAALDDVLHVPFRRGLVAGYDTVVRVAKRAGAFGATLSGSGSTIVAVTRRARADAVAEAMSDAWRAIGVASETLVNPPLVGGANITYTQTLASSEQRLQWQ
ncbi:MAG: homoserine kinase, partial [Gemmatimonadaceae bacterium]|nr:homoserine kinase [Gemmatimonadaceae bacterium]